MVRSVLALLTAILWTVDVLHAQTYSITGGSGAGCQGILYDSGGEGASGYQNGEDYTFTLCPDIPGNVVYLTFFNFNLDNTGPGPTDYLSIYDGDNTGEITLGTYGGTTLQNIIVSGTVFNTSGCLTLVFHSNANGTGVFAAGYQCTTPCEYPTAVANMSEAAPAMVCVGEEVTFNGSASYAISGFAIQQFLWDFDDGTLDSTSGPIAQHAFASDGEYVVQLTVTDDNDCHNLNLVDLQVLVSTTPDFSDTDPSIEICFGETVSLYGDADPVTWTGIPDANFGDGVFLPDDVGQPFTSTLLFEQFDPGQQITNTSNILDICVDMEHTFMGDLVLQVICPNGQTTLFHQQGGGGTYIGAPNDSDTDANPIIGECWHYCWSPTATNGTWIENLANTTTAGTPASGSINPGTYESVQPFSNLIGCPLNGQWTFQSTDLWAIDNGFICGWEINFDPSLIPDLTQFTLQWGAGADSSLWVGGTTPDGISANGDDITFTATTPGVYPFIYAVTDDFGCTYDTTIMVTVDEPFQVDAGPDLVICNDPLQLGASIVGAQNTCDWTLEMNDSFGDGWNGSQATITVNGVPTVYTVAAGTGSTVTFPVAPGDAVSLDYSPGGFENEVDFVLYDDLGNVLYSDGPFPLTGAVWNGPGSCNGNTGMVWTWTPAAGLSDPAIQDPIVDVMGPTSYTVTASIPGHPVCQASDQVNITVAPEADPGLDSLIIICPNAAPFQLIDMLGGTPATGGVWTDAGGNAAGPGFDPQVDASAVFLYTVTSALGCVGTAQLGIQVLDALDPLCCGAVDAGIDGGLLLCASDAPADLFTALGGTPSADGTWSDPSGAAHDGTFDPSQDADGAYTYTVAGGANCPSATAVVQVSIAQPVSAGGDGTAVLCSSSTPIDLFALLIAPDAGGAWSDPVGAVNNGSFDPAVDQAGIYQYMLAGNAPCPADVAEVIIDLAFPPNAGANGELALCSTDPATDLFTALAGIPDPNGTWSDPTGAPHSGSYQPQFDAGGDYTYTVTGQAPCPDASSAVTVFVATPVDAGTDGAATVCVLGDPVELFPLLGGAPSFGGIWMDPLGGVHGGSFDPASDATGGYVYMLPGNAPCPSAMATVTMSVSATVNAGPDAAIALCATSAVVDLSASLSGADTGGNWTDPLGDAHDGLFDPDGAQAGDYRYIVQGLAPCPGDTALISVSVVDAPYAGSDAALSLCTTNADQVLFDALGGTPDVGGSWTGPSGVDVDGIFLPTIDAPGDYRYVVPGTAPCVNDTALVIVSTAAPPDAGSDGSIALCANAAPMQLFDALNGTPDAGGVWSAPGGSVHDGEVALAMPTVYIAM